MDAIGNTGPFESPQRNRSGKHAAYAQFRWKEHLPDQDRTNRGPKIHDCLKREEAPTA
jgi:hypothetical protein